ncbi:MAG: hypothetical protein LBE27_08555 [Deltaproteobacteria bacterium]|jgi:hypothetical protein|nr:hypothetical protein [Deltaproteobacteria bacterium]
MRFFWLLFSPILLLSLVFGAPLVALEAPRSYAEDETFAGLLFEIGAYYTASFELEDRPGWRLRTLEDSGEVFSLALRFDRADPWPVELELTKSGKDGDYSLTYKAPYGAESLTIEDKSRLDGDLSAFLKLLEKEKKRGEISFTTLEEGLTLAKVPVYYGVRMGPPEILIIKADPKLWSLNPYSEAENPLWAESPGDITLWSKRLEASKLIFTGPQYYADRSAMGYLKRKGKELESRAHPQWKGYLGSDPAVDSHKAFEVHDKARSEKGLTLDSYQTQLQSFMILDASGKIRVQNTDKLSSRIAAGEASDGSIAVVFAAGSISLHDLGTLLRDMGLGPMVGLDGGLQSQLAILEGDDWVYLFGEYSHNMFGNLKIENIHPTIPFVLALEPN